jgi:hypothetical protein
MFTAETRSGYLQDTHQRHRHLSHVAQLLSVVLSCDCGWRSSVECLAAGPVSVSVVLFVVDKFTAVLFETVFEIAQ